MKYVICFDTICSGFSAITDAEGNPILYNHKEEAQAEINSDPELYEDCFICLENEIGHKTIYYPNK